MPDCAIFADTGWKPKAVYDHLDWLMSPNVLPFLVHVVSAGNIRERLVSAGGGEQWASVPAFTRTETPTGVEVPVLDENEDGEIIAIGTRRTSKETVSIGMIRRQCTTEFKIVPIRRKVRELAGLTRKRPPAYVVVEQWIGISTDEIFRAKLSFAAWQVKRFPLMEKRMSRADCLAWLTRYDYPLPPKSACIGCPFHDDARWRHMRDHDPDAWLDAVEVDHAIRTGLRGIRGEVFLHRSAVPLDEADLSTPAGRTNARDCAVSDPVVPLTC